MITVGTNNIVNGSGDDIVVYLFRSIEGLSFFGVYAGNANADGPFVNLGFRPLLQFNKKVSASDLVNMFAEPVYTDNMMTTYWPLSAASTIAVEADRDFVSNGFKIRHAHGRSNSGTQMLAAWAAQPFKYANAR